MPKILNINECSAYLDANQVEVEHRYFNKSVPDSLSRDYLTVFNAASGHHRILEILKHNYQGVFALMAGT